jgi:hypothetical protein
MRAARVLAAGLLFAALAGLSVRPVGSATRLSPAFLRSHSACAGHERWQIKTLLDDDASHLNKRLTKATVDQLRADATRPAQVSAIVGRIKRVEFRRYRLRITLHEAFREDDGDLHVVIHDPNYDGQLDPEQTMIMEFPNADCEPQNKSAYAPRMATARAKFVAFVKKCTGYDRSFGKLVKLVGHADVNGVGFWDIEHGTKQRGRAPNDIEIHPVLKFAGLDCG